MQFQWSVSLRLVDKKLCCFSNSVLEYDWTIVYCQVDLEFVQRNVDQTLRLHENAKAN